ncbi:MAG: hypothetical protein IJX88_05280 [Clostridia bacterium]|nr:hypothetical protein [Clostridia bacterium]
MQRELRIAGLLYTVNTLDIGQTVTFPAAGLIHASAIRRSSKNNYEVYLIMDGRAYAIADGSMSAATERLQKEYDDFGSLLGYVNRKEIKR